MHCKSLGRAAKLSFVVVFKEHKHCILPPCINVVGRTVQRKSMSWCLEWIKRWMCLQQVSSKHPVTGWRVAMPPSKVSATKSRMSTRDWGRCALTRRLFVSHIEFCYWTLCDSMQLSLDFCHFDINSIPVAVLSSHRVKKHCLHGIRFAYKSLQLKFHWKVNVHGSAPTLMWRMKLWRKATHRFPEENHVFVQFQNMGPRKSSQHFV